MNPILSQIIQKLQTIIANPSQLFTLAIMFGIAVLILHFLAKAIGFLFRIVLAALLIGAIVWFFF